MERDPRRPGTAPMAAASWQAALLLGVITLVLGVVVSVHPSASLNVIAMLLGILMVVTGIFHLARVFDSSEQHRAWLGTVGLLGIVIGVILVRHLHLTLAIIGLIVGVTWIAQGISSLMAGITGSRGQRDRLWWAFFGVLGVAAGIVVVAVPVSSVTALAVLFGIWFAVMGVSEIAGALMLRHALSKGRRGPLSVVSARRAGGGTPTGSPAGG